jgi:hypothetical protein
VAEVGVDFGAVLRPRPAAKAADAKVNIMATHKRMLRVLFIGLTSFIISEWTIALSDLQTIVFH